MIQQNTVPTPDSREVILEITPGVVDQSEILLEDEQSVKKLPTLTGREFYAKLQKSVSSPITVRVINSPTTHHWASGQFMMLMNKDDILYVPTDNAVRAILAECASVYNTKFIDADKITPAVFHGYKDVPSYEELEKIVASNVDQDERGDLHDRLCHMFECRSYLYMEYNLLDEVSFIDPAEFKLQADTTIQHVGYTIDQLMTIFTNLSSLCPNKAGDNDFMRSCIGLVLQQAGIYNREPDLKAAQALTKFFGKLQSQIKVPELDHGIYHSVSLMQYINNVVWLDQFYDNVEEMLQNSSHAVMRDPNTNGYELGYTPRTPIWVSVKNSSGDTISGNLESIDRHDSMFGTYFTTSVSRLSCTSGDLREFTDTVAAADVKDFIIKELTIDENDLKKGRQVLEMLGDKNTIHTLDYRGLAAVPGFFGPADIFVSGVVIYDPVGCRETDFSTFKSLSSRYVKNLDKDSVINVHDIDLDDYRVATMCTKMVGFSLDKRRWVLFDVANSRPVVYDKTIINKLVMPNDEKQNIQAIVENLDTGFVDIVAGKGGGAIFLLFGPPGLGKTLTAEAISAVSERPLYKLSVGELGTSVDQLEKSLQRALDYATRWDATLLFDEADIFLEARDSNNIERNAMVGVFLRLLEYYQGIMFLTTNRVKNFDSAFFSRITYSIEFQAQTHTDRVQVWSNLLTAAKLSNITDDNIHLLANNDVNNRQIKTCITNAQRFALAKGETVQYEHLARSLQSIVAFNTQIKHSKDSKE